MDKNKQEFVAVARRNWKLVLGLGVLGLFVAVLLVIGGAAGLAWTSTEQFCIGCHEMRDNVYAEYKDTVHDRNRTGVRLVQHVQRPRAVFTAAPGHQDLHRNTPG